MTKLGVDVTILASAVIVLGGLAALVRALVRLGLTLRDNITATKELGSAFRDFSPKVDGRLSRIEAMLGRVWERLFPGEDPPG